MRKLLFIKFLLFLPIVAISQTYIVTAENGLWVRNNPHIKAERIEKLPFGYKVQKIQSFQKDTLIDPESKVTGSWVKVSYTSFYGYQKNYGYLFDAYIKDKDKVIQELQETLNQFPEAKNHTVYDNASLFYLKGDFFGDSSHDIAVKLKAPDSTIKIGFINYNKNRIYILGSKNDPFGMEDYNWAEVFKKVNSGEALWSNYEDDFRNFEEVPENEKVKLNYNAVFLHASEACGGGFIFWKNGKFNWLQQE